MTNGFMVQYVREGSNIPVLVSSKSATLGLMLAIIAVLPAAAPCKKNAKQRREEGCDLGHVIYRIRTCRGSATQPPPPPDGLRAAAGEACSLNPKK